jgi:hypothetical protein
MDGDTIRRARHDHESSNGCARSALVAGHRRRGARLSLLVLLLVGFAAQARAQQTASPSTVTRVQSLSEFLAGSAIAFAAHESGHLFFDLLFDADPGIGKVDFHGIPFFAITHRNDLSPRREFTISSAGFWAQHAGSEWLLTRRPELRRERAPFKKGVLAFNVLTSVGYAGAAFARTGPLERDTRGMASSAGIDERWVGLMILAPAVLDAWRYFQPDAKWAAWGSRAGKVGMVLLVLK